MYVYVHLIVLIGWGVGMIATIMPICSLLAIPITHCDQLWATNGTCSIIGGGRLVYNNQYGDTIVLDRVQYETPCIPPVNVSVTTPFACAIQRDMLTVCVLPNCPNRTDLAKRMLAMSAFGALWLILASGVGCAIGTFEFYMGQRHNLRIS